MAGRKLFGRQKRRHYRWYRAIANTGMEYYFKDTYLFMQRHKRKDYNIPPDSTITYMITFNTPTLSRMGVIYGE